MPKIQAGRYDEAQEVFSKLYETYPDRRQPRELTIMLRPRKARTSRLIPIGLTLFGLVFMVIADENWSWLLQIPEVMRKLMPRLGEACAIAGLLALFVDEYLKERLLREAANNILEHVLGFDQEPEIRDRIKSLIETKLFRRDVRLSFRLGHEVGSDMIYLEISSEGEVVNPSVRTLPYQVKWTFQQQESPRDCKACFVLEDGVLTPMRSAECLPIPNGNLEAKSDEVEIRPRGGRNRYRFMSSCVCETPRNWFHSFYFGSPTIGITVVVTAPEGWRVGIAGQPMETNQTQFHSNDLYMPGDHFEIHWNLPAQEQ